MPSIATLGSRRGGGGSRHIWVQRRMMLKVGLLVNDSHSALHSLKLTPLRCTAAAVPSTGKPACGCDEPVLDESPFLIRLAESRSRIEQIQATLPCLPTLSIGGAWFVAGLGCHSSELICALIRTHLHQFAVMCTNMHCYALICTNVYIHSPLTTQHH